MNIYNNDNLIIESTRNLIGQFKQVYGQFSCASLQQLPACYQEDVRFIDPVHEVQGLSALTRYFEQVVHPLNYCIFDFKQELVLHDRASLVWVMTFSHPRVRSAKPISVPGSSFIQFTDKIHFHQDYYDMGAMLYEHLPLLGRVVHLLKNKLSG